MAASAKSKWGCRLSVLVVLMALASGARSEVVLHGSGSRLEGNIEIGASLGEVRGSNLFHSFSVFNVLTGENAVFTGSDSIRNVISRVTGGTSDITGLKASIIDGPVSVAIPGANFYFINPNGVILAESGSIDASGSIYIGTADVVRLADGGAFYADPAQASVLTTADPAAFGFLTSSPSPVELNGPWLGAPYTPSPVLPGKTFALVGGDIEIRAGAFGGAAIVAPGATFSLASVASAGDAVLASGGNGSVDLSAIPALGQIHVSGGSYIDVGDPEFVGNGASGSIYIRGGQLSLSPAGLLAQTFGDDDGGQIDIAVRGALDAETDAESGVVTAIIAGSYGGLGAGAGIRMDVGGKFIISDGSILISESYGPGAAGAIEIKAGDIEVRGQGLGEFTGISSDNYGSGMGAPLTISTGSLNVLNGAYVGTHNSGTGSGGMMSVDANSVLASGTGAVTLSLSTETVGGDAGNLIINTRTLELRDGARISSSTGGFGHAGEISIVAADRMDVDGELSGVFSATVETDANVGVAGNAGTLNISTPQLQVRGGVVDSTTVGDGDAGAINVNVGELQLAAGAQIRSFSGGYDASNNGALVVGDGAAGRVSIVASQGVKLTGADANASPSGLLAETRGIGAGGDVSVQATSLSVNDGATISSSSLGSGLAGNVTIQLSDSLDMRGGSIATRAVSSDGGNIAISAQRQIHLGNSQITTSVESGVGGGGNIAIDPQFVILQNSQIIANAFGGPGGNIQIVAGQLIADPTTSITASSALGIDGTVNIDAPDSDVSAGLAILPASFLDAASLMQSGCGAARAGLSSLVEVGRGGLPPGPDDYLTSQAIGVPALPQAGVGRAIQQSAGMLALKGRIECQR